MKRLIPCLFVLPFLTSCNGIQAEYYDSGYYHPHNEHRHGYDHEGDHRQGEHGHPSQAHQEGAQHGHGGANGQVVRHPSEAGPAVHVEEHH